MNQSVNQSTMDSNNTSNDGPTSPFTKEAVVSPRTQLAYQTYHGYPIQLSPKDYVEATPSARLAIHNSRGMSFISDAEKAKLLHNRLAHCGCRRLKHAKNTGLSISHKAAMAMPELCITCPLVKAAHQPHIRKPQSCAKQPLGRTVSHKCTNAQMHKGSTFVGDYAT